MKVERWSRVMGALLLVQLAGLIVPFVLLLPLERDFLIRAAASDGTIRAAIILLFANGGLTIGLSLIAAGRLRGGGDAGPAWLVAAGVITCVTQAFDNACLMAMLAVSQRFVEAAAPDDALRIAGDAVRLVRQETHAVAILAIDVWIASLYVLLHRRRSVPRMLTAFGLVTVGMHFVGIPLGRMLGYAPVGIMGMPMALGHIALATWLLARGLRGPAEPQPGGDPRSRHGAERGGHQPAAPLARSGFVRPSSPAMGGTT